MNRLRIAGGARIALACTLSALLGTQSGPARSAEYHFDEAADYSAQHHGLAVVVMIDGKIAFERYDNGETADTPVHIASATKSFWGPAIVAMMDDGIIKSFDENISDTITEWKSDPQ